MQIDRPKTLSEHREHFAKFVAILTGEMGVQAVFGDEPGSKGSARIVLPKIESLDAKRLDFLYALCLREAGFLSMSKRSVSSIASHKTQGELATSFALESGRVERALMRKFAGASEILDAHWKREAADPELSAMAFGFDPSKATVDQTFAVAAKWALVGKPAYGWDKLFPKAAWDECVAAVSSASIKQLIDDSRLRKWDDARELAGKVWGAWTALRGGDKTEVLAPSPKAKAIADAQRELTETLPQKLSELTKKEQAARDKVKAASDKVNAILGDNADRLKELNRQINALGKQKAPFANVASHLAEARQHEQNAQASRQAAAAAQANMDAVGQEGQERAQSVSQEAAERAAKDGAKQEELRAQKESMEEALARMRAEAGQLSDEAKARVDALEQKIAKAREDLASKQAQLESSIEQARQKAQDAEGSKREKLEEKMRGLAERLAEAQAKAAGSEQAAQEKIDQAKANDQSKAESARERVENQIAELERKLEKAMQEAAERQSKAASKAAPTARMQKRQEKSAGAKAAAEAQAQALDAAAKAEREAAAKEAARSPKTNGMTEEQLIEEIERLESELAKAGGEKESIEAPAREARHEASEARKEAKEAAHQAAIDAFKEMQKLQEKLDAQGIECDLVERMEEIEGWEGANEAQREFDKRATEELGEPVINGSGGGAGMRNALEEIALRAQGIEEINPNEIFAGVEKLSPLSGFSETGAVDGSSGMADKGDVGSGTGFVSAKAHLVWRKDRDKVVQAPRKDAAVIGALKKKFAPEIAKVKRAFAARMKPSFKSKFRGGREEGQLDGRSIWKLAARQGDDYYEIDCKKPDNKASASILVDLSGSLASLGQDASERLQACALMISEGLSECNIEHEVLGFSAPYDPEFAEQKIPDTFNRKNCRLETVVAKNFSDKGLAGLASLEIAQADNSDGESLRIALGRLSKRSGKKKILFLISDGKPFMQDADVEVLDEDLRRALMDAAAKKVSVVSIGFGPNGHPVLGSAHIGLDKIEGLADALDKRLSSES